MDYSHYDPRMQDRAPGSMLDWLMSGLQPWDFEGRSTVNTRCCEPRLR